MYLKHIAIKNIGPISKLNIELPFTEDGNPKPIIFVGENGTGKTITLSQIIDSFYEISGSIFSDIKYSQGMGYKYYKISGDTNIKNEESAGFSALQFKNDENKIEYFDKVGDIKTNDFKEYISDFSLTCTASRNEKKITNIDEKLKKILDNDWLNNVYFYQPAYRYEEPFWKVDDFKKKVLFSDEQRYNGKLGKEIEIISSLNKNKAFLMDLVLDQEVYNNDTSHKVLWNNINTILKEILQNKHVRFGIGERGNTRVGITIDNKLSISIDNLSLGESVLLNLFINIIRHSCQNESKPLNYHRTHSNSVVARNKLLPKETIPDYFKMHKYIIEEFDISEKTLKFMIESVEAGHKGIWPKMKNEEFEKYYEKYEIIKIYKQLNKNG